MCHRQPLPAGLREEVQFLVLVHAQGAQTAANLECHLFILNETDVLVRAKLIVLPLLGLGDLLAINFLFDLLRLLMNLLELAHTQGLCVSKLLGTTPDDIIQSMDIWLGHVGELVFALRVTTWGSFALDRYSTGSFDSVGWTLVQPRLRYHSLEVMTTQVSHDGQ